MKKYLLALFLFSLVTAAAIATPVHPVISSFSPQTGVPGSSVTISGSNFDATPANNIVFFGGVKAKVTAATTTSLTVTVPMGAATDFISVSVSGKTGYSGSQFVAIFNCGPTVLDTNSFVRPPSTYFPRTSASITAQGGTLGDIDGDGKLDMILAHYADSFVTVFRNIGSPGSLDSNSFSKENIKLPFKSTFQLEVGDLNGDGKPELILGCFGVDSVYIFQNNSTPGTINLTHAASLGFIAASSACRIRVNDLDDDGKPEVIVVNRNRRVAIFQNNGSSTITTADFTRNDILVGNTATMNDIAVADMNLDGKPDLVVPEYGVAKLHVYLNNGGLSFADSLITTPYNGIWGITTPDLDGDGKPEIAGSFRNNAAIFYYQNTTASGTFSLSSVNTIAVTGTQFIYSTASDINGDGKVDLLYANLQTNGNAYIVQNNSSSGTISLGTPFHLKKLAGAICISVGDIDQDGAPDIFMPDNSNGGYTFRCKNSLLVSPSTNLTTSADSSTISMPYTVAGGVPTQYKIIWDSAALAAGFTNIALTTLPASSISLALPSSISAGTYHGSISVSDGNCIGVGVAFTITLTAPPNTAPVFTAGTSQTLNVCTSSRINDISSLLKVFDPDSGQTMTWDVTSDPNHGTLSISYTTTSSGDTIVPQNITYTPDSGYTGTDAFRIRVRDGALTGSTLVNVTVNPLPTSMPLISAGSYCEGNSGAGIAIIYTESNIRYQLFRDTALIGDPQDGTDGMTVGFGSQEEEGYYKVLGKNIITGCTNWMMDSVHIFMKPKPVIMASNPVVTPGTTSVDIPFTITVGSPTRYNITYGSSARNVGFTNVSTTTFPVSPLTIAVPANAPLGYYLGAIKLFDDSSGCTGRFDYNVIINDPVTFVRGRSQSISLCKNNPEISLDSILSIKDKNSSQSITWSVASAPLHGTLVAVDTLTTNSDTLLSTGLTYQPPADFIGTDQFKIYVSDGFVKDSTTINVTVNNLPDFSLRMDTIPICYGLGFVNIFYNVLTGPFQKYSITWDSATIAAGFENITDKGIAPVFAPVSTPITSGLFTGTMYVKNSNGCYSVPRRVAISILPPLQTSDTTFTTDTILYGQAPPAFTGHSASGGSGSIYYAWEQYYPENNVWDLAQGNPSGINYQSPLLTQNTSFRRLVGDDECETGMYDNYRNVVIRNTAPSTPIDSNTATNEVNENAPNGTSVGITAYSEDLEQHAVKYSLTDNAGGRFAIDSITGVVTVADSSLLNYEVNTSHTISVQASDSVLTSSQTFTIYILDVNEAPSFTSNGSFNVDENNGLVATLTASDPDAGSSLSYSIVGGTDSALFSVAPVLNRLKFRVVPNFEHPSDADSNNVYNVIVRVTDGLNEVDKTITISVNNVNEAPSFVAGTINTITTCQNVRYNFKNDVKIIDEDLLQQMEWDVVTTPAHGNLTGFPAGTFSTGIALAPPNLFYSPVSTFHGRDSFVVKISDGTLSANLKVIVTVNPTPDVAAVTDQTVCNTNSTTAVTFSGSVDGTTFSWTNDKAAIGLDTSGSGDLASFTALNNTFTSIKGDIIVIPSANGCVGAVDTFAISVNPTPDIDSIANQTLCNSTSTTAVTFNGNVSGTTYSWTNNDTTIGLAANGTGDIASFTATNAGTLPVTATITVTPSHEDCDGASRTFTITVNPTPTVGNVSNISYCNNDSTYAVTFTGDVSGTTFNWTNDHSEIGLGASGTGNIASFQVLNTTNRSIMAIVKSVPTKDGCSGEAEIFTLTVNPTPSVNAVSDQTLCNTESITAVTFSGAVSGTTYSWTNSETSIGLVANGDGDIASFSAVNANNSSVTTSIIVTPKADGCFGARDTFSLTVNPTPTVDTIANQTLCNNTAITAISFSGSVNGAAYNWTNDKPSIGLAASGTGNIASFTATNATGSPVTATITVTPKANNCEGTARTFTIRVNPTPSVNATTDQMLCNTAATTAVSFSGLVSDATYSWTNDKTSIGLAASGTGDIASFNAANTGTSPVTATIIVTPKADGCFGTRDTFTVTVNPTPDVNAISNQTLCNSESVTAITFSGVVNGTDYDWTNDKPSIGLAASGSGDIASFAAANTTSSPITATITVTPKANNCTGTAKTFTITVNPTPDVNTVSDQTLCNNNSTVDINFGSAVSHTTFDWTNDEPSIGLAASGTGDITSFTATNTTSSPVTATITITPKANNCIGTAKTFTITVKPSPTMASVSDETLCNNNATTATAFSSDLNNTTFAWTNDNTNVGLAASGNGDIASYTAMNTTNAPINANITIVPTTDGCVGNSKLFVWTVNPTPVVDALTSQTICNGNNTDAITFNGAVSGTVYAWSNSDASIGIPADGNGDIASFIATNITRNSTTATLTIVPSANGCVGDTETFNFTVNPTPDVVTVSNQTVCNSFSTSAVTFTGSVSGTTYAWTNSDASIGLAANGTGDIASFATANSTSAPVTSIITVIPTANNCSSAGGTFTITVNPTPGVNAVFDQELCTATNTAAISFSSPVSGTTYSWINDQSSVGLNANGTGDIASFTASNTTADPVIALIIVTPSANGCIGPVDSFEMKVNPAPILTSTLTPTALCDSTVFNYTATSLTTGTTFSWDRAAISGISNAAATGSDDPGERLMNTTSDQVDVKYTYTLTANNCSNTQDVIVAVKPTPHLSGTTTATVCSESPFTYTPASATTGTSYAWTRSGVTDITPANGNGTGNISETLTNGTLAPIEVQYIYTLTAAGCQHTESIGLTVNPSPAKPVISLKGYPTLCSNTQYVNVGAATTEPAGVNYTWSAVNAEVYSTGAGKQYCLVNFNTAGTAVVTLSANVPGIGCITKDSFMVEVGSSIAHQPKVIYFNDHFVCKENTVTSYQWGYDDKVTLAPTILTSEVNQDYFNSVPDLANKSYWVITMKDNCLQKTYYNLATGVNTAQANASFIKVYPNPATTFVDVEINSHYTDLTLEIIDMLGKTVGTVPVSNQKTRVQVDNLAMGMYFINCYHNGEKVDTQRFIIQK